MDVVFRLERVTVTEVLERLPSPPSYSAVRALMRILEEKGHLRHDQEGARYIYYPTTPRDTARLSAMKHLVATFFDGSTEDAVAALLDASTDSLSENELDRLARLIENARQQEEQ